MAADNQDPKGRRARCRREEAVRKCDQHFVVPNGDKLPREQRDAENNVADASDLERRTAYVCNKTVAARVSFRGWLIRVTSYG
jgi:hypothetical protein